MGYNGPPPKGYTKPLISPPAPPKSPYPIVKTTQKKEEPQSDLSWLWWLLLLM